MNCNELRSLVSDYFDKELPAEKAKEFEENLKDCTEAQIELERLKNLTKRLRNLTLSFEPPPQVISELTENLLNLSLDEAEKAKSKKEKKEKEKESAELKKKKELRNGGIGFFRQYKKSLGISPSKFIIILVTLIAAFIFYFLFIVQGDTSPWKIEPLSGSYSINGNRTTGVELFVKDNVSTDILGKLKIKIKQDAEITLDTNSSFEIVSAKRNKNEIILRNGSLFFYALTLDANFILKYDLMKITDFKSNFVISILKNTNVLIEVSSGLIKVEVPDDEFFLGSDYICEIKNARAPLIPYHKEASEKLMTNLDYLNNSIQDLGALTAVVNSATEYDALTLLRLIEKVPIANRDMLYQKLSEFFPPPKGVTKQGVVSLKKSMLEEWFYSIEWQI